MICQQLQIFHRSSTIHRCQRCIIVFDLWTWRPPYFCQLPANIGVYCCLSLVQVWSKAVPCITWIWPFKYDPWVRWDCLIKSGCLQNESDQGLPIVQQDFGAVRINHKIAWRVNISMQSNLHFRQSTCLKFRSFQNYGFYGSTFYTYRDDLHQILK